MVYMGCSRKEVLIAYEPHYTHALYVKRVPRAFAVEIICLGLEGLSARVLDRSMAHCTGIACLSETCFIKYKCLMLECNYS
jgi:hypothetical protein